MLLKPGAPPAEAFPDLQSLPLFEHLTDDPP
jgi:hypothetical protein